jgi:hypothetical protein
VGTTGVCVQGCRDHLKMPVAQRYKFHDDCERAAIFGRLNDWKLVELLPANEEGQEIMEEDEDMQLQERTDAIAAATAPDDFIAMRDTNAEDGYNVLQAKSEPYQLDTDTRLDELLDDDGNPVQCSAGSVVIDAWWMNHVDPHATSRLSGGPQRWFTPFAPDDPKRQVRVPTHMILLSGFEMGEAKEESVTQEDYDKAWRGVKGPRNQPNKYKWGPRYQRKEAEKKGARILPTETHSAIMDELDERAT